MTGQTINATKSARELPAGMPSVSKMAMRLCDRYGGLQFADAVASVGRALDGLRMMGMLQDPDAETVLRILAERDIRLLLGLEIENAHLDPQQHQPHRRPAD